MAFTHRADSLDAMDKRLVLILKALARLLRHKAVEEGLEIDNEGYVDVEQLLQHQRLRSLKATLQDVEKVVNDNEKKRFAFADRDGKLKICAVQGHLLSGVGEGQLEQITPEMMPSEVYHGTYRHKLDQITKSGGLSRMKRNHIHFTLSAEWSHSGIRGNCNVLIYIDTQKLLQDGYVFYRSQNGVVLTAGNEKGMVPLAYFAKVVEL